MASENSGYDYQSIEMKWQRAWFEAGINKAERDEGRKKFFLIFAYPGISGYLHVGHMRGFTYADVITRYKRMRGYNVLFPAGFHATGLPAVSLAKRVERRDSATLNYLRRNGCPEEVIERMSNPEFVVDYFSKVYTEEYWKRFGFLIDYDRAMSTISEGYKRFIQWQFRKLNERGYLAKKPHHAPYCPNCGPVAVDASETDVSKGGNAEVLEFTVIKFRTDDGLVLPAATLRPETIFGVSNMWLNPNARYVRVRYGGEVWVMSREGAEKLAYQKEKGSVSIEGEVDPKDIIGRYVEVPFTSRRVIVLPSKFVDPKIGTGVVMSVPAHAPYDWIALDDLKNKAEYRAMLSEFGIGAEDVDSIEVIPLIKNSPRGQDPAGAIVREMGVEDQGDSEKLEEATKAIYKEEFHTGILNENCMEYGGMKVSEAKDTIIDDLIRSGAGERFLEFSEEVICRCGSPVYIALVPEQWFIRYSDEHLTLKARAHATEMSIIPEEYYRSLPGILDWYQDRACIRKGSWLGTEFPFKRGWIIEPISDSTLYPAYYIISKYINSGALKVEDMDDAFFDYVFGLSTNKPEGFGENIEEIKRDFEYWYPLDINLGGKEHMTVHFPVFIMNHVAVMPERFWPRGIFVHWWIIQKGGKISKSKGGAEPIPNAAREYGVDTMRLYYCHIGNPNMDIEWSHESVMTYKKKLERLYAMYMDHLREVASEDNRDVDGGNREGGGGGVMDAWLKARLSRNIRAYMDAMDQLDLREGANIAFYTMPSDLRWYVRRGGGNAEVKRTALKYGIMVMAPFTPHIAEELWSALNGGGFVSTTEIRGFADEEEFGGVEVLEDEVVGLLEDIGEIRSVTGIEAESIYIYLPAEWKYTVAAMVAKKALESGKRVDMGGVMKDIMAVEELRRMGKAVSRYVGSILKDIPKMKDTVLRTLAHLDRGAEASHLKSALSFIKHEVGCNSIHILYEDQDNLYDPKGRARSSRPLKPGIYME